MLTRKSHSLLEGGENNFHYHGVDARNSTTGNALNDSPPPNLQNTYEPGMEFYQLTPEMEGVYLILSRAQVH